MAFIPSMETKAEISSAVFLLSEADFVDNELPFSVNAVVSNDDLLIEILILLPIYSLHVFKTVSTHWLALITDANFTLRLSQIHKLDRSSSGFLVEQPLRKWQKGFNYDFVSSDNQNPANTSPLHVSFPFGNAKILQSCNGLLLCCDNAKLPYKYYVYNPLFNKYKMLPRPQGDNVIPEPCDVGGMRMAFDLESTHYKVIHATPIRDYKVGSHIQIQIYSSETCSWSVCRERFEEIESFYNFANGIYLNGTFHWLTGVNNGHPLYVKLDIFDKPVLTIRKEVSCDPKLLESCGRLLLLCRDEARQLRICEKQDGYPEWSLRYIVNLDKIIDRQWTNWCSSSVWSIFLGKSKADSFMVLEVFGKVVQYDIGSKTLHTPFNLGSVSLRNSFQFKASLGRV